MFLITFYIFSLLLSYTDCRRFIVPNIILISMIVMLFYVGWIEDKIYLSSFIVPIVVLVLFIILLLLNPKMILGGGDIKYMMVIAFYLPFTIFPLFMIVTGIIQSLALLYTQNIRKRRIVPMVPLMFFSVTISEFIVYLGLYSLGH